MQQINNNNKHTKGVDLVMTIALSIAALIASVAFAALVVFLSMTLKSAERTMDHVAITLEMLERQMEGITRETTELLEKTNKLADDINQKSESLNGLFDGVKGIGDTVKDFNHSLHNITTNISRSAAHNQEKASQALKWGAALVDLVKKAKK